MEGTRIAKIFVLVLFIYSSMADNKNYSSTTANITSSSTTEDLPTTSNEVSRASIDTNNTITETTTGANDTPIKVNSTSTITPNEADITTTGDIIPTTITISTEDPYPTTVTKDPKPITTTEDPKPTTVTPPSNFDGLSFLGGILLAVGAMILLFVAYKYFGPRRGDKGSYNRF